MTIETVGTTESTDRLNGFSPKSFIPKLHDNASVFMTENCKKFTVYLNGVVDAEQEVTVEFDQITDWNDFLLELDSAVSFSAPTNEVFTLSGERLSSIMAVKNQDSLVISSGQSYVPLQYKSGRLQPKNEFALTKNIPVRKSLVLGSSRKFVRSGLTKSVYAIGEAIPTTSSSSTSELNSLLKTMSEEQVCFREASTSARDQNHQVPNSVARQPVHPKPRPASCYGAPAASVYPDKKHGSRIPKRIQTAPQETTVLSGSISTLVQHLPSSPHKTTSKTMIQSTGIKEKVSVAVTRPTTGREKDKSRQELLSKREFITPRIVYIIRTGTKPRKVMRHLLNHKTARSFEQVLSDMTERLQASWGAVRKVFTLSGIPVELLEEFFKEEKVFLAYPSDRHSLEDFALDPKEIKIIPNYSKLCNGTAMKGKSDIAQQLTPQKQGKSPRATERATPSSYPTHPKYLAINRLPAFILEKYDVGDIIGDGNFAVVRGCVDRISGVQYALKVIDKTKSGLDAPPEQEVQILKSFRIKSPNIIRLFEDYDIGDELFLIMEYVAGGDLFDAIAQDVKFSEEESVRFMRDIGCAITYLHSKSIVHRDIKPENLLVCHENGERIIKVADFGLAHYVQKGCFLYTVCGTPTYVAPEILAETGYSLGVDIWSIGVILYILLCGYPPFAPGSGEQAELFDLILMGDFGFPAQDWDEISDDAKDLIMKMIETDTDHRLSAEDFLDHPWLCIDPEEAEAKRNSFYRSEFSLNMWKTLGLHRLGGPVVSSPSPTASTSLETSNSS